MKRSLKWIVLGTALLSLLAPWVLTGCGDAGGKADYRSPVMLTAAIIPVQPSDDEEEDEEASNCRWTLRVDVNAPDPRRQCIPIQLSNIPLDPDPDETSSYMDIMIQDVTISYTRLDSGHDVPAAFTQPINILVPVDSSVTAYTMWLRVEQLFQVPLLYLNCDDSFGYEPSTGLTEMHLGIHAHFRGRTLGGQSVTADCSWYAFFVDVGCHG